MQRLEELTVNQDVLTGQVRLLAGIVEQLCAEKAHDLRLQDVRMVVDTILRGSQGLKQL
jgi:hypothetical protein